MIAEQENFEGNEEHLKMLLKSIKEKNISLWNRYCEEQGNGFHADLKNAKIRDCFLDGVHLINADLTRIKLTNVKIRDAMLSGALLEQANLKGSIFSKSIMKNTILNEANIENSILANCDLSFSKLNSTILKNANLKGAQLMYCDISNSNLNNANLFEANLANSICIKTMFYKANLTACNLSDANLKDANFGLSRLITAKFDRSNITGICLYDTQRDNWSIVDVVCESVTWDPKAKNYEHFEFGEFEALFGSRVVEIEYPDGIKPYQYLSFPSIMKLLNQTMGERFIISFISLSQQGRGNSKVKISVANIKKGSECDNDINEVKRMFKEIQDKYDKAFLELKNDYDGRLEIMMEQIKEQGKKVENKIYYISGSVGVIDSKNRNTNINVASTVEQGGFDLSNTAKEIAAVIERKKIEFKGNYTDKLTADILNKEDVKNILVDIVNEIIDENIKMNGEIIKSENIVDSSKKGWIKTLSSWYDKNENKVTFAKDILEMIIGAISKS